MQEMEKATSALCPRIQAMLGKEKKNVAKCDVLPSIDNLFNISYYMDQLVVDLSARPLHAYTFNTSKLKILLILVTGRMYTISSICRYIISPSV